MANNVVGSNSLFSSLSTKPQSSNSGFSQFSSMVPSLVSSFGQGVIGFQQAGQGIGVSIAGANMSSDAFKLQGVAAMQAAQYNSQLEQLKSTQLQVSAARQYSELLGQQQTAMAATGLQSSSKSFLMLSNETLDALSSQLVKIKDQSHLTQEAIMFQGAQQKTTALNQAAAAKFQGQVAKYQAQAQQARAIGGAISSVGGVVAGGFSK